MKTDPSNEADLLQSTLTSTGSSLASLSQGKPLLLVLLRHSGCTFCRKAMADIARLRPRIEKEGTQIVLGHMGTEADFQTFAARYGLQDLPSVADPERRLYRGLGLRRGSWMQLMGPRVWWQGALSVFGGHGLGPFRGDVTQMPGAFLIHRGKVLVRFEHQDSADKPDYVGLAMLRE